MTHAGRRLRANLHGHSVRLQDAVRLGLGLAVGVLAVHLLALQHGFWVALATLSVIKSDARRTGRSLEEAVVGTAVGFGVAAVVIVAIGSRPGWLAAALPLSLFAAFYAKGALSFPAGQAAFTLAVLVMFNLLAPFGWSLGVVRVEDVAAGALVGLAVGVLAWPRGAGAALGWITARLVVASCGYLVATLAEVRPGTGASFVPGPSPGATATPRQSALDAAVLADDALAELLEEPRAEAAARWWAEVISFGNRLRYAGEVITTQRGRTVLGEGRGGHPAADDTATAAAAVLADTCRQLAARLVGADQQAGGVRTLDPPVDGGPQPDAHPDPDGDLTGWLRDLTESAAALLRPGPAEGRSA